jgi:hypothetical protein
VSDNTGIKINKRRGYTVVFNDMLPEGKVSARAWGVYVYLLSRPDGWECRVSHLRTVFTEGRDAIYTVLKELAELGLMGKETYLEKGMKRSRYVLNADQSEAPESAQTPRSAPDTAFQDPGNPDADIQDSGSSDPEKPGQVTKDLPTTDTASKEEPFRDPLRSVAAGEQGTLAGVDAAAGGASSTRATGTPETDAKARDAKAREIVNGWFTYYERTFSPIPGSGRVFHSLKTQVADALKAEYTPDEIKIALANTNGPGKAPEACPSKPQFTRAIVAVRTHNQSGPVATVHRMDPESADVQRRANAW